MAIDSIRATEEDMIVPFNEHPHKLKKGGKVKGYANGNVIEGDPTKTPITTTTPQPAPAAYNPEAFKKDLSLYKNTIDKTGKVTKYAFPMDEKTGMVQYSGPITKHINLLTAGIKDNQAVLNAYMQQNKLDKLTPEQANTALKAAGKDTYENYLNAYNDYSSLRQLTPLAKRDPNTEMQMQLDSKRYGTNTVSPEGTGNVYSLQPTTPYDSTQVKLFDPYVVPQKKANGGKVMGKGLKGYIEGGEVDNGGYARDTTSRKYSTDTKDYLHDTGLGIVDWSLQGVGAQDVIKDKDYKTKAGSQTNRLNEGVGAVGSAIGGAVLDYYVPGLGTAIRSGKKGVGNAVGTDQGISQSDKDKIAKVDALGNVGGSLVSGLGGGKGMSSMLGKKSADTTTAPTVDENGINTKTGEIATPAATNTNAPAQVADGNNLTGQALNDWKAAQTGEAQAQVLAKYNSGGYGLKQGGPVSSGKAKEILRDGTAQGHPLTKKQKGYFGVIASGKTSYVKANGGAVLGPEKRRTPMMPDNFQNGGDINYTSAADKVKIAQKLYEDNYHAPEFLKALEKAKADLLYEQNVIKTSGSFLRTSKDVPFNKIASKKDQVINRWNNANVEDLKKAVENSEMNPMNSTSLGPEEIQAMKEIIKQKSVSLAPKKIEIPKKVEMISDYNQLNKGGKIIGPGTGTSDSIPAKLEDEGFVVPAANAKLAEQIRAKFLGDPKGKIAPLHNGGVAVKVSNGEHYFTKEEKELLTSNGVNLDALAPNADSGNTNGSKAKGGKVKDAPYGYDENGKPLTMSQAKKLNAAMTTMPVRQETVDAPVVDQTSLEPSTKIIPVATTKAPVNTPSKMPFDVGEGISIAQAGLGLQQLLKQGKRPVDTIDPDFAKSVEEAKAESGYGISPIEREIANASIDKNRAADTQNIINLSGGNSGVALGNIRAASMAADDAKNNLSAQSETLRLQKKRYADSLIAQKAGMSKQLFNEKLDAFNTNQTAGAMLLGAGIKNAIGASRYKKELDSETAANNISNPTFNIGS